MFMFMLWVTFACPLTKTLPWKIQCHLFQYKWYDVISKCIKSCYPRENWEYECDSETARILTFLEFYTVTVTNLISDLETLSLFSSHYESYLFLFSLLCITYTCMGVYRTSLYLHIYTHVHTILSLSQKDHAVLRPWCGGGMAVRVQGKRFDIHAGFNIVFLYSSLKLSPPIPRGLSAPLTTFGFGTPECLFSLCNSASFWFRL